MQLYLIKMKCLFKSALFMYLLERRLNTETMTGVHGLGFHFHKQRAFKKDQEVSPIFV